MRACVRSAGADEEWVFTVSIQPDLDPSFHDADCYYIIPAMDVTEAIERSRDLQFEDRADEALQVLLEAAKQSPHEDLNAEIALFYAERAMSRMEDPDAALKDLEASRRWAEVHVATIVEGMIRVGRKEYDRAEEIFSAVLENDPKDSSAWHGKGMIQNGRGDLAGAAHAFAKTLDLDATSSQTYCELAFVLRRLDKPDEAVKLLENGIRNCPQDDGVLLALADLWLERGRGKESRGAYRHATERNRANLDAWLGLARAAAHEGQELEMHQALDRAMKLDEPKTREWLAEKSKEERLLGGYSA